MEVSDCFGGAGVAWAEASCQPITPYFTKGTSSPWSLAVEVWTLVEGAPISVPVLSIEGVRRDVASPSSSRAG